MTIFINFRFKRNEEALKMELQQEKMKRNLLKRQFHIMEKEAIEERIHLEKRIRKEREDNERKMKILKNTQKFEKEQLKSQYEMKIIVRKKTIVTTDDININYFCCNKTLRR